MNKPASRANGNARQQQNDANVPAGFKTIEAGKKVPTVHRDSLGSGAVLEFIRTDRWPDRSKKDAEFVMHHFKGKQGVEFSVWGMAALDARLARVQESDVIFIRFDGMEPHPTDAKKTLANWVVAVAEDGAAPTLTDEATIDENILAGDDLPF